MQMVTAPWKLNHQRTLSTFLRHWRYVHICLLLQLTRRFILHRWNYLAGHHFMAWNRITFIILGWCVRLRVVHVALGMVTLPIRLLQIRPIISVSLDYLLSGDITSVVVMASMWKLSMTFITTLKMVFVMQLL